MDFKINFDDLPFSIDFNRIINPSFSKLQTVIYYLIVPQNTDVLFPDLGIKPGLYSLDKMLIIIELENLFYRLKEKFGINVKLKNIEINSAQNIININISVDGVEFNVKLDKERINRII
jgi:hypothetical protein